MNVRLIQHVLLGVAIAGACAADCRASSSPIVLVQGTVSTPNEAERNYAASVTRRLSRWLQELNLSHLVVPDQNLGEDALHGARVAILGYNPFPTVAMRLELESFANRGGKLIVFYGADTKFAEWMGLKLGSARNPSHNGNWSRMRFVPGSVVFAPAAVEQESHVIRPAVPAGPGTGIVATWERADGSNSGDPAWLRSPRGFWMTHVLLDDGDEAAKKQMILALVTACDPSEWKTAAAGSLTQAGRVGRFTGLENAADSIAREAAGSPQEWAAKAVLSHAQNLYARARSSFGAGKYADVVETCPVINQCLCKAYAMVQTARPGELRGVWDHPGTGLYPGSWEKTAAMLETNGFTDVFSNLLWPGAAHFPSEVTPRSNTFAVYGDQVAAALTAAHRHNLRLHAWKVCWRLDQAAPELISALKKQGRLQMSADGVSAPWLCPSCPENVQMEKNSVRDLLKRYAVDGIHLDYIRYQSSQYCYCPGCRARFEARIGKRVARWPADVTDGALVKEYRRWRCAQITRLVRDVSALARELRPGIKVSAAVYGKYPSCVDSVAQEWALWIKEGLVDFVCPMNYTTDLSRFGGYVKTQVALPGAKGKIVAGLGVTATESRLDPAQTIDQIRLARKEGAPGFVIFDLNLTTATEILPLLRLGLTSR
jgi:uncharacterized lipoprotein YddW (UPF0748 family)